MTRVGSKYSNSRVSRSKNHSEYGLWDLNPCYLGTWTFWEIVSTLGPMCLSREYFKDLLGMVLGSMKAREAGSYT